MGGLFIHVLSHIIMQVTINGAYMWYQVDGQASLNSLGYYAVPFIYGPNEFLDDEPVACGPRELIVPDWDPNDPLIF